MNPEASFPNLGIEFQNIPEVAFSVFGIDIYTYSVCICIGISAGIFYALREAKRTNQDPELYSDFLVFAIMLSVLGARLYYVIFSWDDYKNNLIKILAFRQGGLAIYGGVITAIIVSILYAKKKNLNFGQFADTMAPGLILGQAFGRIGNFFNAEVFGSYTDSLFALRYLKSIVNVVPPSVAEKSFFVNGAEYIQVQPTFLYESVLSFLTFIIMNIYKKHKKFEGELTAIYLFCYGVSRFIIEGIRTDQLLIPNTNIPVSQVVSLIMIILSITISIIQRKKLKTN